MPKMRAGLQRIGDLGAITILVVVNMMSIVLLAPIRQADAAVGLSFSELATHPQAAAQSNSNGKILNKLKIFNNKVYAAYGDYDANTGPIAINPYDLNTNSFTGIETTVSSESLGNWKIIDGKLYTTTIDAKCSGSCPSGYAVGDNTGTWQLKMPINAEHIFDVETLTGTDIWLFGGSTETAYAWRSVDGGDNWTVAESRNIGPGSDDSERYYWGANLNGTMYMQAEAQGQTSGVQSYDGSSSNSGTSDRICRTGGQAGGPNPVVFDGKIICTYANQLVSFDGSDVNETAADFDECDNMGDMNVTGDYFEVLCSTGSGVTIKRTSDFQTWQTITGLPTSTASFTIDANTNKMYVGTTDSKLYVASLPAPDSAAPAITITSPTAGASASSLNITTSVSDNVDVTKVEFYFDGQLLGSKTAAPFSYAWYNQYGTNDWETPAGTHSLTAKAFDFEGNSTMSGAVQINLIDPAITVEPHVTNGQLLGSNMITRAPDGTIWIADTSGLFDGTSPLRFGKVDSSTADVTYYDPGVGIVYLRASMMAVDADNTVWYVDCSNEKVVHFNPQTTDVDEYPISSVCTENTVNIAAAADGSVYVAGLNSNDLHKISNGNVSTVTVPTGKGVVSMTSTYDGGIIMNLSTGNNADSSLARINGGGNVEEYYVSDPDNAATYISGFGLTMDRNGTTWASSNDVDTDTSELVEVKANGAVTRHTVYANGSDTAYGVRLAENGDIWLSSHKGYITRFVPSSGYATSYRLITPASPDMFGSEAAVINATALGYYAQGMATAADGSVWVGDGFGNRLIELTATTDEPQTGNDNEVELSNGEGSGAMLVQTPVGTQLTCSSTVRESSLDTQDKNFNYPLGLVNFCFTTNQADNEVSLTFVTNLKPNQVQARKYNSDTKSYADISGATIVETTYAGKHALKLTYTITDNGTLDLDPTSGQIKDPVGLAIRDRTGLLANAGTSILGLAVGAGALLIAGPLAVRKRARRRAY